MASGIDLLCFSQNVFLNPVLLHLRRPIRERLNISLPFAVLVTNPVTTPVFMRQSIILNEAIHRTSVLFPAVQNEHLGFLP
jgi:hypothetical protein